MVFIELRGFAKDRAELGLSDEDLQLLQLAIMDKPNRGAIIPGTGGLRKIRFAPRKWKTGKRGAVRVCCVYFRVGENTILFTAYSKAAQDNIPDSMKSEYRKLIRDLEQRYSIPPAR